MTSFSVVIPTRNRPDYLRTAIESVLKQEWPARDIIVGQRDKLDRLVEVLLEKETIDGNELKSLLGEVSASAAEGSA